ncbi:hypothetical protein MNY64_17910 (plasmid) [Moellerella wisconsensis]|uniref:hypothetical protein n=1 Tax=Moellerella wisconsensis TaxID=158849 RepID=UPI001F4D63AB|nr:hypothetical protein [Moellerella wisconsensis]UNH29208.1 hypothetical protein MNY64_17910 [Moellerella wisconsensis]
MKLLVAGLLVALLAIFGLSSLFGWNPLISTINDTGKFSLSEMDSELVNLDGARAGGNGGVTDCLTFYKNLYLIDNKSLVAARMYYYFSADNNEKTGLKNVNNAFIIEKYVTQFEGGNMLVCQYLTNNPEITAETITKDYLDNLENDLSKSSQ